MSLLRSSYWCQLGTFSGWSTVGLHSTNWGAIWQSREAELQLKKTLFFSPSSPLTVSRESIELGTHERGFSLLVFCSAGLAE